MRVAAHRSLCEPGGVLSVRNPGGCSSRVLGRLKGSRTMDRNSNRSFCANGASCHRNEPYQLGKAGNYPFSHFHRILVNRDLPDATSCGPWRAVCAHAWHTALNDFERHDNGLIWTITKMVDKICWILCPLLAGKWSKSEAVRKKYSSRCIGMIHGSRIGWLIRTDWRSPCRWVSWPIPMQIFESN